MSEIQFRRVATNGIELNIAEAGEGPLVLLTHGFPESWYSWRHQLPAIAAAGFHVVAPDMRGYGRSDMPEDISTYNQVNVIQDVVGLIPAMGYETAIIIGHDWGAPTAWGAAELHPDRITAVGALSFPYSPRADAPPLDTMKAIFKDVFFYQLYFQEPGVAEKEWEADIRTNLRKFFYLGSGAFDKTLAQSKGPDADLLSDIPDPGSLGDWCTDEDLDYYTAEFTGSGFRGPLNYYRNHNLTWELTADAPGTIQQPAMFVAGAEDGVILMAADALNKLPERVPNLVINALIPEIGHWTQQEAPAAVNQYILEFLSKVS